MKRLYLDTYESYLLRIVFIAFDSRQQINSRQFKVLKIGKAFQDVSRDLRAAIFFLENRKLKKPADLRKFYSFKGSDDDTPWDKYSQPMSSCNISGVFRVK